MWYNKRYKTACSHMSKLTALEVEKQQSPGRYADGNGLYLEVTKAGTKTWLFRYQLNGKRTQLGLGSYNKKTNSLAQARRAALDKKLLVAQGIHPKAHEERSNQELHEQRSTMTFEQCAEEWFANMQPRWSNKKHAQQNFNTLQTYVFPHFGKLPIEEVSQGNVRDVLDPIWYEKPETASRVRSRIDRVCGYAIANGYRSHPNPAVWRGHLDQIYPPTEKIKAKNRQLFGQSRHHKAMPHTEVPAFYTQLTKMNGSGPLALRLCILTALRSYPIRMARWEHLDLERKVWNIPGLLMKGGEDFRVALSEAAVQLLSEVPRVSDYIFVSGNQGRPLSEGAMLAVLKISGTTNATVHDFRSSFRDYVGEETDLSERIAEYALAHSVGSATERAYARGDMLEKRFLMMNIWANYVTSEI